MGKGGWIEVITSDGTPDGNLRAAASSGAAGSLDGMRAAIANGADVHHRVEHETFWGGITVDSPIVAAVANRRVANVEFLLDAGVSIESKDGQGRPPLLLAASSTHLENQYELAQMLLQRGADVNALCSRNKSAIERALSSPLTGAVRMATLLAVNGASITASLRSKIEVARTAYLENYPESEHDEPRNGEKSTKSIYGEHLAWVDRVMGCPPFQIAIIYGMHAEASTALQLGRIDPADCLAVATGIHEAAAKSKCAATIVLAKTVLAGWSPSSHHLYHSGVRSMIKPVLLVANRLRSTSAAHAPVLDQHLWMHVLRFVERSWWPAPALVPDVTEDSWDDLAEDEQAAASLLGWAEDTWGYHTELTQVAFAELSEGQQQAANVLGYDETSWDDPEEFQFLDPVKDEDEDEDEDED